MLQAVKEKSEIVGRKNRLGNFISQFIIAPFKSGLAGFAAFFSILVFTKALGYMLGTQTTFEIVLDDVFLSAIGFVLVFLIRLLENVKENS